MAKLKVKNVGPIKDSKETLIFNGVTIFIGNQGTGKSTISKLFSTLSWIEKALVRGDFKPSYLKQYNRFKKQLAYQNISNYINKNSYISYSGDAYEIIFKDNQLEVRSINNEEYNFPKIMYIPAERNFVSTVDRPDLIKRLPLPLYTFLEEYEYAKSNLSESVKLPLGNLNFEYRKQNKKSWLVGDDYKIELLEASSGFQSLVPLYLVTESLSKIISNPLSDSHNEKSVSDENKIKKEIDRILSDKTLLDSTKKLLLDRLSKSNSYSSFVNVVEEPEQNLFPTSQKEILFSLLANKNKNNKNKLILTTHSPYIINYLSIAIQGKYLEDKIKKSSSKDVLLNKLYDLIPKESLVSANDVVVYELDEKTGTVMKLETIDGIPSDKNYLNQILGESNLIFDSLLEIEQEL